MSFGKKERRDRPGPLPQGATSVFEDDTGFRSELMGGGQTPEEFSDESLFGEDRIEDLIEKKNSFLRAGGSNMMFGGESSFRSRGGNKMFGGMRTQDDNYSTQ